MFVKCQHFLFKNKAVCIGFYTATIQLNLLVTSILVILKTRKIKDSFPISLQKIFHSLSMSLFNLLGCFLLFIFCNDLNLNPMLNSDIFDNLFLVGISTQFSSPLILIYGQYELILVLLSPTFAQRLKKKTVYFYMCMIPYFLGLSIVKAPYEHENHRIMYFGLGIGILGLISSCTLLYLINHKDYIQTPLSLSTEKKLSSYVLFSSAIVVIWFFPSLVIFILHFESFDLSDISHKNDHFLSYIPIVSQLAVPLFNLLVVSTPYHLSKKLCK